MFGELSCPEVHDHRWLFDLGVKMDLDELSKAARVVVTHRLSVAECLQQRVRCNKHIHTGLSLLPSVG